MFLFHFRNHSCYHIFCWWNPMLHIVISRTLLRAWYSCSKWSLKFIIVSWPTGCLYHEVRLFSKSLKFLISLILIFTNCASEYGLSDTIAICSSSSTSLKSITGGYCISKIIAHKIFSWYFKTSSVIAPCVVNRYWRRFTKFTIKALE